MKGEGEDRDWDSREKRLEIRALDFALKCFEERTWRERKEERGWNPSKMREGERGRTEREKKIEENCPNPHTLTQGYNGKNFDFLNGGDPRGLNQSKLNVLGD